MAVLVLVTELHRQFEHQIIIDSHLLSYARLPNTITSCSTKKTNCTGQ